MWEFRVGNTFGATAFTSYGLFWISFVLIDTTFAHQLPTDPTPILGMYALGWGIFTAYMFVASLGGASRGVSLVFFLLALTFITLAIALLGKEPAERGLEPDLGHPRPAHRDRGDLLLVRVRDERQLQEDRAARLRAVPVTAARGPAGPRRCLPGATA